MADQTGPYSGFQIDSMTDTEKAGIIRLVRDLTEHFIYSGYPDADAARRLMQPIDPRGLRTNSGYLLAMRDGFPHQLGTPFGCVTFPMTVKGMDMSRFRDRLELVHVRSQRYEPVLVVDHLLVIATFRDQKLPPFTPALYEIGHERLEHERELYRQARHLMEALSG